MRYRLRTGEVFYVAMDTSESDAAYARSIISTNTANAIPTDPPAEHKDWGWDKMFGIFLEFVEYMAPKYYNKDNVYVRDLDKGATGRGENQPGALRWETGSTKSNWFNYLTNKETHLGGERINVFYGKLPTTPTTRNGAGTGAQARYWSISGYTWELDLDPRVGNLVTSVMDDEIVLDAQRRYVIVVSQTNDRPTNATAANGVTWMNAGNERYLQWVIRWSSIYPTWHFGIAPTENNLTWTSSTKSGLNYNRGVIGYNNHAGRLGEYLPKHNFMDKRCFESLGSGINWTKVNSVAWGSKWKWLENKCGV
jgi:hypothetical protein